MIFLVSEKQAFSINRDTPLLLIPAEGKIKERCQSIGHIGRPNCEKGLRIESADFEAKTLAQKARKMGLPIASLNIRGGREIYLNTSGEIQYRVEENDTGQIVLRYVGVYDNGIVLAHESVSDAVDYLLKQCPINTTE